MASDGGLGHALTTEADATADAGLPADNVLRAWRERGDDRLDPVGFHFIEALARRAAGHGGAVRATLDARLAQLLDAYAARIAAAGLPDASASPEERNAPAAGVAVTAAAARVATPPAGTRGPLAELAAYLAYPGAPGEDPDAIAAQARRDAYPDLPALDGLREIWSGLSADRQVRQSQEQVHKNAGPLNSNQLVHRALSLMRELSPGYLQQFVTYTETLAWMEQLTAAAAPPAKETARAPARKGTRAKSR